jgi:hypothetical protein
MVVKQTLPTDLQPFTSPGSGGFGLTNGPELVQAVANQTGQSVEDAITASTTQTQVGGRKIVASFSNITVANNNDAVTLPQAIPGATITFVNSSGQTIQVFPFLGDKINVAAANAAVTVATATTSDYYCTAALQWWGGATTNEQ